MVRTRAGARAMMHSPPPTAPAHDESESSSDDEEEDIPAITRPRRRINISLNSAKEDGHGFQQATRPPLPTPRSSMRGPSPRRLRSSGRPAQLDQGSAMDVDEDAELHARFNNDPVTRFIEPGMDDAMEGDEMDQSSSSSTPPDAGELLAVSGGTVVSQPQNDVSASDARSPPVVVFSDQDVPSAQGNVYSTIPSSPEPEYQESLGSAQSSPSSDRYETPPEQSRPRPGFETDHTADEVPVVVVKGDGLIVMLKAMGGPKWCGLGRDWIKDFNKTIKDFSVFGEPERKFNQWSQAHTRKLSLDLQRVFKSSLGLMALFKLAPRLFEQDIAAQQAYFAAENSQERLRSSANVIEDAVDSICSLTALSKRKQVAKDIARKAIPMLLLVLRYAFIMGSRKDPFFSTAKTQEEASDAEPSEDDGARVQRSGRKAPKPDLGIRESAFPQDVLLCLASISSWIEKLHSVMMRWIQTDETDNDRQYFKSWKNLRKHIHGLHESIDMGLAKLEQDDLEAQELRIQLIKEKDHRAKAEREARARQLREASDRQMELFFASTQGMGGSQRRSVTPRRRSYRPNTTRPPTDLARTARVQNRRRRKSSVRVYQEDNHGWSWEDDNALLHTIRRARRPGMEVLRALLPDHSIGEIKRRILDLKEKSRIFYEVRGIPPPEWCYVG